MNNSPNCIVVARNEASHKVLHQNKSLLLRVHGAVEVGDLDPRYRINCMHRIKLDLLHGFDAFLRL